MKERKNRNIFGNKKTGNNKNRQKQSNNGTRQQRATYRRNRASQLASSYQDNQDENYTSQEQEAYEQGYQEGESETEAKGSAEFKLPPLPLKVKLILIGVAAGAGVLVALFLTIFGGSIGSMTPSNIADQCRLVILVNTQDKLYDGEIDLEDYVAGTVASKGHVTDNVELYKVSAIESRTKAMQDIDENCKIDESKSTQKYTDPSTNEYQTQIQEAVQATTGVVLTQEGLIYLEEININYEEALNMITIANYNHQDVLKKYIGEDMTLENASSSYLSNIVNGFSNPVANFHCSSGFGCRYHPVHKKYALHKGIDMAASSGEPVYAAKDGVIEYVLDSVPGYSEEFGYGNYITIVHDDGTKTRYAHLLYGSISSTIYAGAPIKQGQMIGKVGSTGTSTGPHLHYEIFIDGNPVNPYDYLDLSNLTNPAYCNNNASVDMSYCGW